MAGLDGRTTEMLQTVRNKVDLVAEYDRINASGVRIISRDDPAYPPLLRELVNGPPCVKGRTR
jgi:DNA processing protein